MESSRSDPCPCCGELRATSLYEVRGHTYFCCVTCGSARLDPLPQDPGSLYGDSYFLTGDHGGYVGYDSDHDLHSRNAKARLDLLAKAVPPGPRNLLDVGCATGYTLDEAKRRHWDANGVEISEWARGIAIRRGLSVFPSIQEALETKKPDLISFFQVLEHMDRPDAALSAIANGTAEGAVVAIETWDRGSAVARIFGRRWHQANPPSVIHLFTRRGLELLLRRQGFEPTLLRTTAKAVSFSHLASIAEQQWGPFARAGQRVLNATGISRRAFSYRFGDLITAVAIRRST